MVRGLPMTAPLSSIGSDRAVELPLGVREADGGVKLRERCLVVFRPYATITEIPAETDNEDRSVAEETVEYNSAAYSNCHISKRRSSGDGALLDRSRSLAVKRPTIYRHYLSNR